MKPLKIAVVDDDQIYQFIINRTLSKLSPDSKVLNFSNCADFFVFIKKNTQNSDLLPDLVLLDLNTPFMNGWEFLNSLNEVYQSLSKLPNIYLVSSSVDPNDEERARTYQSLSNFCSKPLSPEQLDQFIAETTVKQL